MIGQAPAFRNIVFRAQLALRGAPVVEFPWGLAQVEAYSRHFVITSHVTPWAQNAQWIPLQLEACSGS